MLWVWVRWGDVDEWCPVDRPRRIYTAGGRDEASTCAALARIPVGRRIIGAHTRTHQPDPPAGHPGSSFVISLSFLRQIARAAFSRGPRAPKCVSAAMPRVRSRPTMWTCYHSRRACVFGCRHRNHIALAPDVGQEFRPSAWEAKQIYCKSSRQGNWRNLSSSELKL